MSNETEEPLAGALRAANELNGAMVTAFYVNPQRAADIIARESGLAELVKAVEDASPAVQPDDVPALLIIGEGYWLRIVAAARRVREG